MNNNFTKYPKSLAYQETISKRKLLEHHSNNNIEITNNINNIQLQDIKANTLNYAGAYPYIFDFLCFMCTHNKDFIKRQDNPNETHYRIEKMPVSAFIEDTLGDYTYNNKKYLIEEIKKLTENNNRYGLTL